MKRVHLAAGGVLALVIVCAIAVQDDRAVAQRADGQGPSPWVQEIEDVFIRSENCKQCHDRHYEEWKGIREQTPALKTFGRVDAALLHGTAFESPVFRTVLGLWIQTNPTPEERQRCLSCHAPAVKVFPQHVDKITDQILTGNVEVEGIGCTSCHLIHEVADQPGPPPTFEVKAGNVLYGPFADPEENLVHPSAHLEFYNSANYCTSCHFDKVKDVTRVDIPGEILKGRVCQDCHMEQSIGSSTSRRGALTRGIGRHWFRGVVVSGILTSNRNLQAEWMPRVDVDVRQAGARVEGTVSVRTGSLPHLFPDGDPVLKQFFITVTVKDKDGHLLGKDVKRYGLPFEKIMRGPIPDPLVKGGTTNRSSFSIPIAAGTSPAFVEALLTYSLIPEPSPEVKARYLATLSTDEERSEAVKLIDEYAQERVLTFRTKALEQSG